MTGREKFTLKPDYQRSGAPYRDLRHLSTEVHEEQHMSGSVIARLGAAGAIAYGVMEILGDSLSSTTDSTQTPQQIAAYFAAHSPTTLTWIGIYIETLGAFAFLLFGAYLWSVGRDRKEGRLLSILALSGGIVQAAVILAGEPPKIEAYFRASQGMDPQLAAAMLDLNNASFFLGFMPQALLVAAAAGLAIRTGLFPSWLGWAGLGVAIALLAVVAAPADSGLRVPVNLIFFGWLAVTGAVLLWRAPAVAVPALSNLPASV
jgi:hypothetical protein